MINCSVCSVYDTYFPSFKTYAMFVTCILFHSKRYVCSKHSLSFKSLVMFMMHILFHLKQLYYCSQQTISFIQNVHNVCNTHSYYTALCTSEQLYIIYFSYIYTKVLLCISKINVKKIET